MVVAVRAASVGGAGVVGGIGEVPRPPRERRTSGEGEVGASKELRIPKEGIEVEGDEIYKGGVAEVDEEDMEAEEGGMGGLQTLEDKGILTQDVETGGTTLDDACNGFNDMICLVMLWTVWHRWPTGARFAFNCYGHSVQLLIFQTSDVPVILMSHEGVNHSDPLSMVPYGITLPPPGGGA